MGAATWNHARLRAATPVSSDPGRSGMASIPDDAPPAVPLEPDLAWNRRAAATRRNGGLVSLLLSVAVLGIGLLWYVARGQTRAAPGPTPAGASVGDYVLPALRMPAIAGNSPVPETAVAAQPPVSDSDRYNETMPARPPVVARAETRDGRAGAAVAVREAPNGVLLYPSSTPSPEVPSPVRRDAPVASGAEPGSLSVGFTPANAQRLPALTRVITKGTAVRCVLETAIDSELAGLVSCLTEADTYGGDGAEVLLPRGSRLLGEVHSDLRAGRSRVLVLWVEARTTDGLLVPLDSPGTDTLGRAGVPGSVDTHFMDRFGAAMMISAVDAGFQGLANRARSGTVVVSTQGPDTVLTEVLRSTVAIPPTVRVAPGAMMSVLVKHDIDFGPAIDATDRSR